MAARYFGLSNGPLTSELNMSSHTASTELCLFKNDHTTERKSFKSYDGLTSFLQSILRQRTEVWWLHCENPGLENVETLARLFQLDQSTFHDIILDEEKEKYEELEGYFFINYSLSEASRMCIVTTKQGVVTIKLGDYQMDLSYLTDKLGALKLGLEDTAFSSEWVCYALIDAITDSFAFKVDWLEEKVNHIEKELFLHNGQTDVKSLLLEMCKARDLSIDLMHLFQSKPHVIENLAKYQKIQSNRDVSSELLLSAAHGHLCAMIESAKASEDILARGFVNYISIMRVKMVHSNTNMEQIVGAVALIGLALIPSHLITSAWAMNVEVPGKHFEGETWFWGVVAAIVVLAVAAGVASVSYYLHIVRRTSAGKFLEAGHHLD